MFTLDSYNMDIKVEHHNGVKFEGLGTYGQFPGLYLLRYYRIPLTCDS